MQKDAGSSLAAARHFYFTLSLSRVKSDLKSGENEIFLRFLRLFSILPIGRIEYNLRNLRNISFSPLFKSLLSLRWPLTGGQMSCNAPRRG